MTTTIKRRYLERFGFQLVEEGHVLPVMRDERVDHFAGPGYVWLNFLIEDALAPIYTGYRANKFMIKARTTDSNDIKVEGSAGYIFNPVNANIQVQSPITKAVARSDQPLKDILSGALGAAIREFVGTKSVLEMASGAMPAQLEAYLRSSIKATLRPYGIQLAELQENGVNIGIKGIQVQQIHCPEWLTNAISMSQFVTHAANLLHLPTELLTTLLFDLKKVEQASVNGNLVYITPESATSPQLTQLLNQIKAQPGVNGNGRSDDIVHRRHLSSTNGAR